MSFNFGVFWDVFFPKHFLKPPSTPQLEQSGTQEADALALFAYSYEFTGKGKRGGRQIYKSVIRGLVHTEVPFPMGGVVRPSPNSRVDFAPNPGRNQAMRDLNAGALEFWRPFIFFLDNALRRLPAKEMTAFRAPPRW